jgi:outer membrane receptor protein involved in Fe transport
MNFAKLLILIISLNVLSSAQQRVITGRVLDENSKPIVSATVELQNLKDSTTLVGAYSDENGKFELSIVQGKYLLKFSYLTAKNKYIKLDLSENLSLKDIILENNDLITEEVVVEAEKRLIELKLDKRVVNVGADKTNIGRDASEILDNIPSVQVDVDGNVSLRGSSNVQIMIDGKQSGSIARDPESLRLMQGDLIDKVEIITNPNARYDAEGESGIINIVLKKERQKGFSSSINARSGNPDNHGISLTSNYRKSFYNLFGSVGLGYRRFPGFGKTNQSFTNANFIGSNFTDRNQRRGGLRSNIRLGSDFNFNENNILTTAFEYRFGDRANEAVIEYSDFLLDNSLYQTTTREDDEAEEKNDVSFDVNYKTTFSKPEHYLSIQTQFEQDKDLEESELSQINNRGFVDDITQRSSNLEFERNMLLQADFVYPFSENGKFEIGSKATQRKIDNDFKVDQLNDQNDWEVFNGLDYQFIYFENIYANYILIGEKFGEFSAQAGLRSEYSDIITEYENTDYKNPREYHDLFPSLNFGYQIADFSQLQLAYSRRINRPRFRSLMPFSSFSDPRNFRLGNPDLDPEYTNSYEANYLQDWNKASLLGGFYFRDSKNIIQRVTRLDSIGGADSAAYFSISPDNVGVRQSYGIELNFDSEIFSWMDLNVNLNMFRAITDGNASVENLDADTYSWNTRISNKIKAPYGVDIQFNFNYEAPQDIPQGRLKQVWYLDFSASRNIGDNATLTLSGRDVFSTRMRRMQMRDQTFVFDQDFQWRGGVITLNFNYRINREPEKISDGLD